VVAGGVSETIAGDRRGDAAMTYLRQIPGLRFLAHPTLPHPEDGSLGAPGPLEGSLAEKLPPTLMRYCENFVLTCALELRHRDDHVRISYRRGEILRTLVNGSESGERLPEVMSWTEGTWRITLSQLALPRPSKVSRPLRPATVDSSTIFGYQVQPPVAGGGTAPPPAGPAAPQVTVPYTNANASPAASAAAAAAAARLRRFSDGPTPLVEVGGRATGLPADPLLEVKPETRLDAKPEARADAVQAIRPLAQPDLRPEIRSSDHKRALRPEIEPGEALIDHQRAPTPALPTPAPVAARPRRGAGSFLVSLLLHALLGVALGLAIVGGYWAFLRWGGAFRLGN
jgi:hypothetical protein